MNGSPSEASGATDPSRWAQVQPDSTTSDATRLEPMLAVELHEVHKRFDTIPALAGLSLHVTRGQITVLLGPNGAGKTTALRVITGAIPIDAGTARTFGLDPIADGEVVRQRCGIVSAKPALYDRLDGRDNLLYAAALYGVKDDLDNRVVEAAARFGIDHALGQMVATYSTGMRTRLALARALLHEPELLLLDEPTSGLDPESSRAVLAMIRTLAADGRTVVMSTHLLSEAEGLADQIVILDDGQSLLQGTQAQLIHRYWPGVFVRFDAEQPEGLDILTQTGGIRGYRRNGQAIAEVESAAALPDIIHFLTQRGVRLTHVARHVPTLEDLYFKVREEYRAGRSGS